MNTRCRLLLCTLLVYTPVLSSTPLSAQMQRVSSRDRPVPTESAIVRPEPSQPQQASASHLITLSLHGVSLKAALREIAGKGSVTLFYNDADLDGGEVVSLEVVGVTELDVVRTVLRGTGLAARTDDAGIWIEREAEDRPAPERADSTGSVSGRVADSTTSAPVEGTRVSLDGTSLYAVAGSDGRFRIAGVEAGAYVITARRLGYLPSARRLTVTSGSETVADIRLVPAPRTLEQVVTTGTIVPTAVREIPTPISVVTEADIAALRPRALGEMLRQAVPGMLAWEQANFPQNTRFSVRGASSLSGTNMKVYIDGVEIAEPSGAAVDPSSIARIEVIRGPQAATLYGSDAIGGVIQIFTKRGDSTASRPRIQARAALGSVQTGYSNSNATLRQEYAAGIRGAGDGFTYDVGGSYTRMGDWIPEGAQSLPGAHGGVSVRQGDVTVDISGRFYEQKEGRAYNPVAATTGYSLYSKLFHTDVAAQERSLSGRITWRPIPWLRNEATLGLDRYVSITEQYEPRWVTPADSLLFFSDHSSNKTVAAYNLSASDTIAGKIPFTLTAGIDHYSQLASSYSTSGALNTTGSVATDPAQPMKGSRDEITNTGYFSQLQATVLPELTLTFGARGERNSSFGDDVGVPVSPRVGLAYSTMLGSTMLKLRGSYGEAILPPSPSQKQYRPMGGGTSVRANPDLEPQRQRGWDAGMDVAFGQRASLGITYYDQTALDLIQFVVVTPPFVEYQYQNVGRIKNSGLEVEGKAAVGPMHLTGQFAIANSRIATLSPTYTGDLRVGDRSLLTPKYTAGLSLTVTPRQGTTITGAIKYVGSFPNTDGFAQLSCNGGTGPCRATSRDYLTTFPSFTKIDLAVTQQLTRSTSAFVAMNNVGNNMAAESSNVTVPILGRVTMVGVEVGY